MAKRPLYPPRAKPENPNPGYDSATSSWYLVIGKTRKHEKIGIISQRAQAAIINTQRMEAVAYQKMKGQMSVESPPGSQDEDGRRQASLRRPLHVVVPSPQPALGIRSLHSLLSVPLFRMQGSRTIFLSADAACRPLVAKDGKEGGTTGTWRVWHARCPSMRRQRKPFEWQSLRQSLTAHQKMRLLLRACSAQIRPYSSESRL